MAVTRAWWAVFKIEALIWVSFRRALANFSLAIERSLQIQDANLKILKWDTTLVLNLCMNYMVHVSSTIWRIKNQSSNSTSSSDNALRLLVLVAGKLYWGLQVTSSFSIRGGLFWERCILKGQIMFEGHWRLQFWTLVVGAKIGWLWGRGGEEWSVLGWNLTAQFATKLQKWGGRRSGHWQRGSVNWRWVCVALLSWAPPTRFCPEDPIRNGTVVQLAIAKGFGNDSLLKTPHHFVDNFL